MLNSFHSSKATSNKNNDIDLHWFTGTNSHYKWPKFQSLYFSCRILNILRTLTSGSAVTLSWRLSIADHLRYCYIDGLVQNCSVSIVDALEILQSGTKLSIYRGVATMLDLTARCILIWWIKILNPEPKGLPVSRTFAINVQIIESRITLRPQHSKDGFWIAYVSWEIISVRRKYTMGCNWYGKISIGIH